MDSGKSSFFHQQYTSHSLFLSIVNVFFSRLSYCLTLNQGSLSGFTFEHPSVCFTWKFLFFWHLTFKSVRNRNQIFNSINAKHRFARNSTEHVNLKKRQEFNSIEDVFSVKTKYRSRSIRIWLLVFRRIEKVFTSKNTLCQRWLMAKLLIQPFDLFINHDISEAISVQVRNWCNLRRLKRITYSQIVRK